MRRIVSALLLCLLAFPAWGQIPGTSLVVGSNGTPITGGTSGDCLTVGSTGRLNQAVCSAGSVTTFSAGTTGLTPSTPTSGAIVLAGTLGPANGGTGHANNAANTLTFSGNFGLTLTLSNTTALTLPTSGTVATVGGNLGVFTGTSLALGGAAIGSNAFAVTGTAAFNSTVTMAQELQSGSNVRIADARFFYWLSGATLGSVASSSRVRVGNNAASDGVQLDVSTGGTLKCRDYTNAADCTFTAGNATFSGATVIMSALASDATHTDNSVCVDTGNGTLYKGSGAAGICLGTSSARYKQNITPLVAGLDQVMALKPVAYNYKPGFGDGGARRQWGFTAEQVYKVMPGMVDLDTEGRPNAIDWPALIPVLVNAVQDLKGELDELKRAR